MELETPYITLNLTTIKVFNLKENEKQWVMDLLGHTLDVDDLHYKTVSSTMQRTKVEKLLEALEAGQIDKYRGKNLHESDYESIE